jgi:hypothetical protein
MSDRGNVIPLDGRLPDDAFSAGRDRLTDLLICHTLIDSFFKFTDDGRPYPFIGSDELLPSKAQRRTEHRRHNTALMVLVDGTLPRPLNKHFRLRASNRLTWRNLQRLAPDLDIEDFKSAHCHADAPEFSDLLEKLLPLDYALIAERPNAGDDPQTPLQLTHMHVKLERLTDRAVRELGKDLGYIERRLFERGEDFVEALEAKFFEYYGFGPHASGRKSAAAMAAQLLASYDNRFCVFVTGQEDCRLTVLDHRENVTQFLLIRLQAAKLAAFKQRLSGLGIDDIDTYAVSGNDEARTLICRLTLARTPAADANARRRIDKDMQAPWLSVAEQAIVPLPGRKGADIPFTVADIVRD